MKGVDELLNRIIAVAWQRAMAEIRNRPAWTHPAYRSAFLLIGDGTVRLPA